MNKISIVGCIAACSLGVSCAAPDALDALDESEEVGVAHEAVISGAHTVAAGDRTSESEAVIAITMEGSQAHTIVTMNADDRLGNIVFDDGGTPNDGSDDTRTIFPGASHMMIFHRLGLSGSYTAQRIAHPGGGALWGDPAISAYNQFVYATSLQIPLGRFPPDGAGSRRPIVNTGGESVEPFIAGACVARSADYGQSWSMTVNDCVNDNGHFYDGSAVISTATGKIFAAFNDVDADEVDVWRTDGPTGALTQTENPFPGKVIWSHPRLKFSKSIVYAVAADSSSRLWMNAYASGAWGTPIQIASNVAVHHDVTLTGGMTLRQANGFDFDVYQASDGSGPVLKFVIMQMINSKAVLLGGQCKAPRGTWSCSMVPGWQTNSSVNCFMPAIASTPSSTRITYQRGSTNGVQVAMYSSKFFDDGSLSTSQLTTWQTPCPDLRGYWGDYDSMTDASDGFHRVFSDSTNSSCTRQEYTSRPLGVSEVVVPFD